MNTTATEILFRIQKLQVVAVLRASGPLGGLGTGDLTAGIHKVCELALEGKGTEALALLSEMEDRWGS